MPAIVRPGILMPVRKIIEPPTLVMVRDPHFGTYHEYADLEDLSDVIYRIMPTETPFMDMIRRTG